MLPQTDQMMAQFPVSIFRSRLVFLEAGTSLGFTGDLSGCYNLALSLLTLVRLPQVNKAHPSMVALLRFEFKALD